VEHGRTHTQTTWFFGRRFVTEVILGLGLLVAQSEACAGPGNASDADRWDTGVVCEARHADGECDDYEATVLMWESNGEVCGLVNETTAHASPDAWFRGRRYEEGFLVQFVDSFQYEEHDSGWALIKLNGNRLSLNVLKPPDGGKIHSEDRFRLAPGPEWLVAATPQRTAAQSCSALEEEQSGLSLKVPAKP